MVFGLKSGLDSSLMTSILLAGCCWPWNAITRGNASSFEALYLDGRCKMYWRSVVLPITDFEDKVTLVVDLPGVSPEGKRVPQPELAASTTGQRSEMRDRDSIFAIPRTKNQDACCQERGQQVRYI